MDTATIPKNKSWLIQVTILGVILGMLLALALKTQQSIRKDSGLPSTRVPALAASFRELRAENENLKKTIDEKEMQLAKLQKSMAQGSNKASIVKEELQALRLLAGLAPVEGPGVILTLRDSPKKPGSLNLPVEDFIVHDTDIRTVVNELRNAGAEVISINDERLIATTAIRCSGNVTYINERKYASPFVIKAIGNPDTLAGGVKMPGGIYDDLDQLGMVTMVKSNSIRIPGYPGVPKFRYAKLVTEGGEQR